MRFPTILYLLCVCILISWHSTPADATIVDSKTATYACALPKGGSRQGTSAAQAISADLVIELLHWIKTNTDYDVTPSERDPPKITFCETGAWINYEGSTILVEENLQAMYDFPNGTILIVQPWSAQSPHDVSALLHELIHDVQMRARSWECIQAPEWQAYKLQEKWLAEKGIASGFDWLQIYFLSRCPKGIHP